MIKSSVDLTENRGLFLAILLIFLILFGVDEPIVNSTINKIDYSCSSNSDCEVKHSSGTGVCSYVGFCANKNWNYYESLIGGVYATSCVPSPASCTCVENRCKSFYIYQIKIIEDCENLYMKEKDYCLEAFLYNVSSPQMFILQKGLCGSLNQSGNMSGKCNFNNFAQECVCPDS